MKKKNKKENKLRKYINLYLFKLNDEINYNTIFQQKENHEKQLLTTRTSFIGKHKAFF